MSKIFFFLLLSTIVYPKSGVDIGQIIKQSFSNTVTVTKKQFTLSTSEMKTLQKKAKTRLDSNIIRKYTVKQGKVLKGYAVLIVKTIRSKKAAILYIVDKKNKIKNIEIVAFMEPAEYKPNRGWQDVFNGKTLEDNLFSGKGIPSISGATLSARAICDASRIALTFLSSYK